MQANDSSTKIKPFSQLPVLPLTLLWLSYGLVGWHLSADHIFWFVGILLTAVTTTLVWINGSWAMEGRSHLPRTLFMILTVCLLIALTAMFPMLTTLLIGPSLTTVLAWQEMQALNLRGICAWAILVAVAVLGLGIGELTDLLVLPSYKGF